MSSSKKKGTIALTSEYPATEFRVLNSNFELVEQGVGKLKTNVERGIYRIEAQFGNEVRSELVAVEAGGVYEDSPHVGFASAAPVEGTSTTHEHHQVIASRASADPTILTRDADAGLVIVVRALEEAGDPPMSSDTIRGLSIVSSTSEIAGGWSLFGTWTSVVGLPRGVPMSRQADTSCSTNLRQVPPGRCPSRCATQFG